MVGIIGIKIDSKKTNFTEGYKGEKLWWAVIDHVLKGHGTQKNKMFYIWKEYKSNWPSLFLDGSAIMTHDNRQNI